MAVAGLLVLPALAAVSGPASAAPARCDTRTNNTVQMMLECVTVGGVRAHQQALQNAADANGGTRASGTPGYAASAAYVESQARAAGLKVTTQDFDFPFFQLNSETMEQVAPLFRLFAPGTDFSTMTYSGSGNVTAFVRPVDLMLPPGPVPSSSTSGCEAADFAGFVPGNIALLQRGTCAFADKAANAQAAGAVGVIIFNEGQPGRTDAFGGTLGAPGITIPVVGTSFDIGVSLQGATVHLATSTVSQIRQTRNVFAELPGARTNGNVVMVGAHLDSVLAGPGINDNGSGSAAILEVARMFAKAKPTNTVRFAWWGAEELNLLGSAHYVQNLTQAEADRIALYLNFDMVSSPNFVRFVYDGDGSAGLSDPGPAGSGPIENVFSKFFADRGLATEPTAFDGRSDYGPFIEIGIPAGGLFTGAEGVKTPAQAAVYGGTAGVAYDSCYHQACDTFANNNLVVLDQNADAIAYSTVTLAYSTQLVNGVPGRTPPGSLRNPAAGQHDDAVQ
ncbi:PA domain-containing protein [Amycolatopsis tolypomycina]|uniref:PA domain-containing protein n=2 Tax=Amycolatopsis tolypomycina TaxID=208445 RepID=A0A1H4TZQ7_9PSEU|nr:PA domain-containing protein [Amycolatopsis tolypomycina]